MKPAPTGRRPTLNAGLPSRLHQAPCSVLNTLSSEQLKNTLVVQALGPTLHVFSHSRTKVTLNLREPALFGRSCSIRMRLSRCLSSSFPRASTSAFTPRSSGTLSGHATASVKPNRRNITSAGGVLGRLYCRSKRLHTLHRCLKTLWHVSVLERRGPFCLDLSTVILETLQESPWTATCSVITFISPPELS